MVKPFGVLGVALAYRTLRLMSDQTEKMIAAGSGCDEASRQSYLEYLRQIVEQFSTFDMGEIHRCYGLIDYNLKQPFVNVQLFKDSIDRLMVVVEHELVSQKCFVIPRNQANLLDHSSLDSRGLSQIEGCGFDLIEARECLAYGRYTAAVYHCMCALESTWPVVEQMVNRYGVAWRHSANFSENWGELLKTLDKTIKSLEQSPKNQESEKQKTNLSEIAGYMRTVKLAWRNPTMHARGPSSPDIAENILMQTCAFLDYISVFINQ